MSVVVSIQGSMDSLMSKIMKVLTIIVVFAIIPIALGYLENITALLPNFGVGGSIGNMIIGFAVGIVIAMGVIGMFAEVFGYKLSV